MGAFENAIKGGAAGAAASGGNPYVTAGGAALGLLSGIFGGKKKSLPEPPPQHYKEYRVKMGSGAEVTLYAHSGFNPMTPNYYQAQLGKAAAAPAPENIFDAAGTGLAMGGSIWKMYNPNAAAGSGIASIFDQGGGGTNVRNVQGVPSGGPVVYDDRFA